MPVIKKISKLEDHLKELQGKHHSLDEKIASLSTSHVLPSMEVHRLKQEKLRLKDMIIQLRHQLIPDIIA